MKNQTTKTPRFIHISVNFDFKTKAQLYIQKPTNPGRPDGSAQYLWFFKMELALYHPSGAQNFEVAPKCLEKSLA
jgi:hypothetical protein